MDTRHNQYVPLNCPNSKQLCELQGSVLLCCGGTNYYQPFHYHLYNHCTDKPPRTPLDTCNATTSIFPEQSFAYGRLYARGALCRQDFRPPPIRGRLSAEPNTRMATRPPHWLSRGCFPLCRARRFTTEQAFTFGKLHSGEPPFTLVFLERTGWAVRHVVPAEIAATSLIQLRIIE